MRIVSALFVQTCTSVFLLYTKQCHTSSSISAVAATVILDTTSGRQCANTWIAHMGMPCKRWQCRPCKRHNALLRTTRRKYCSWFVLPEATCATVSLQ